MKPALSTRQAQVAEMVAEGKTYKQIAADTGMALKTVEMHAYIAASKIPGTDYPRFKLMLWVLNTSDGSVPK